MAFYSEKIAGSCARYSTYDIEFYAIVQAIKHWRHYLFHQEFILYTDHDALKHLGSQDKISAHHASWIAFLQQFNLFIKHQSGRINKVADSLSRRHSLVATLHVSVPGFVVLPEQYALDPFFGPIWTSLHAGDRLEFVLHEGYIFRGNCLCIPEGSLHIKLIKELHDEGHVGKDRTLQLVTDAYFGRRYVGMSFVLSKDALSVTSLKVMRPIAGCTFLFLFRLSRGQMSVWILS